MVLVVRILGRQEPGIVQGARNSIIAVSCCHVCAPWEFRNPKRTIFQNALNFFDQNAVRALAVFAQREAILLKYIP